MNLDELERLERKATASKATTGEFFLIPRDEIEFIAALRNAARELIADAKRYRWLRSSRGDDFYNCHEKDGYGGQILKYGIDLDAAIDTAVAREKK